MAIATNGEYLDDEQRTAGTMAEEYDRLKKATDEMNAKREAMAEAGRKALREAEERAERVNHPSHYTWLKELCGVEVIDITRHMDFDLGNAVKYILRQGQKSEEGISDKDKAIEDLQKAVWYINDKIKMLEG